MAIALACGVCVRVQAQGQAQPPAKPADKTPATPPAKPSPRKPAPAKPATSTAVSDTQPWFHAHAQAVIDRLADGGGEYKAAIKELDDLFCRLVTQGSPTTDAGAFREVAIARRLVGQIGACKGADRRALMSFMRDRPELTAALTLAIKPEIQKPAEVYAVLDRLRATRGADLETYATLTAAICVVHDRPWWVQVNENKAVSPDPVAIFDYYKDNEPRMAYGIRGMPVELLVHLVAVAAPIEDLRWALDKYGADHNLGNRYREIRYDYEHFAKGAAKKSTAAGWSLRGVLANGGVCADQAYFAMTVGQAIGVPAAYVTARSGEVGHAWVGYLTAKGRAADWNFDAGRFGAYQVVQGRLVDPQTRKRMSEASVAIMAKYLTEKADDREATEAVLDAAEWLIDAQDNKASGPLCAIEADAEGPRFKRAQPRSAEVGDELELIEAALRRTPAATRGWYLVRDLAEKGGLSLDHKRRWAEILYNLCGKEYPYFSFEIMKPMILTVDDVKEQDALWTRTATLFTARADLVSEIRLLQGQMWEDAHQPAKAWDCYQDVIMKYVNAGPFVVAAVDRCEEMLTGASKTPAEVADLYGSVWRQAQKPTSSAPEFRAQSNWFRLGTKYAERLDRAGKASEAGKVREQLLRS